ncbi:MAG: hypothetical protein HKO92_02570 [Flavobacteriaceae bacterium]|nr:hypothetical protein [Bacteroidia bacterium]NNK81988.1 hypothetical protein [Flavobacteriaceae bacterium]
MKAATLTEIKKELMHRSQDELLNYCLYLSRFKKENKELLTYLLFESHDEQSYIDGIKVEVEQLFSEINTNSYFYIKKSVRKILRRIKTYIRYSKKKETEVELLIHFCETLKSFKPSMIRSVALHGIYKRQILVIEKTVDKLHEDLQYDYNIILDELKA